jgi:hypothetical protein
MRKTFVASTMMLLAILAVAGTAWASLTGPGVREGKNQTIKAVAVDPAGNTSDVASFRYVIR